jgi:hypothetical protein
MIKRILGIILLRGNWIPIGTYQYAGVDYLVMGRKGITGLITFKTRRMTGRFHTANYFKTPALDIKEQWRILTEGETER